MKESKSRARIDKVRVSPRILKIVPVKSHICPIGGAQKGALDGTNMRQISGLIGHPQNPLLDMTANLLQW